MTRPDGVRLAARVIVLDPDDDVLLFRYDEPPPVGRHWATPGGGLEAAEDYPAAALRELAEETGWADVALLGLVLQADRQVWRADRLLVQHEQFFLARTPHRARAVTDVAAMHDSDGIVAWRWWSLAELDTTDETILPPELAALIRSAR